MRWSKCQSSIKNRCLNLTRMEQLFSLGADERNVMDLANIFLKVGEISPDKTTIVGKDGFLFLYKGNNDVASLYKVKEFDDAVQVTCNRWVSLFSNRAAFLQALGIKFYQIIIPEKSTALPHLAPPGLGPITAIMCAVDKGLSNLATRQLARPPIYLNTTELIREMTSKGLHPFPKTGSHLTITGAVRLVSSILQNIAADYPSNSSATSDLKSRCRVCPSPAAPKFFGRHWQSIWIDHV